MPGQDEIEAMQAHKENLRQRAVVRKAVSEQHGILKKW
ncbi:hypothetical protein LCGC14_0900820 [marine sediment metagenome]|uniref:Uncharacterized protein n=1 Tax=marine sediment metagenome TaxID=412755 RepID=A0A0F9PH96_9ZZZZ